MIKTHSRLASAMGFAVCLGLAFTPVGCGGGEEVSYGPRHGGSSDGPSAPESTVAQLTACANGGAGGMKEGTYLAILVDADVGESGHVERAKVRDTDIEDQGMASCMLGALRAMQVPGYIVQRMLGSGPVSPASRGVVGNILVVGAAVELVPIVIVAAGVTFIVAVTLHVAEEAVEAISQRAEQKCQKLLNQCIENKKQPDWNRDIYGEEKDCLSCFWRCKNTKGKWPDFMCPHSDERPN